MLWCTVIADWLTHVLPAQQRPSFRIIPIWVTAADGVSVNVVREHTVGLSPPDSSNHEKHKNQTLHPLSSLCGRGRPRCEVLQDKGVKDRVSRWFSAAIVSYYHQYLFLPISSWCCYICTWKIAMWTDDFKLEGPFKIQSNNLI